MPLPGTKVTAYAVVYDGSGVGTTTQSPWQWRVSSFSRAVRRWRAHLLVDGFIEVSPPKSLWTTPDMARAGCLT
jgi:hypothetical protein